MTLLAPGALFGLTLLAIPILVHLFKPRRVRQTPFSSLRWLHLAQQRMARRIQWHQVLLFLLRAGFLTLVVLALARPLWSPNGDAGSMDRIIVLDVSHSMGRRVEGRTTPFEDARGLATQLVEGMVPGDRSTVLLTGDKTTVLVPWTADAATYLPAIAAARPMATDTHLDSSFDMLRALLLQRRPAARTEICVLTDNMSGAWTPGAVQEFVQELPNAGRARNPTGEPGGVSPRTGFEEGPVRGLTPPGSPKIRDRLADVSKIDSDTPPRLRLFDVSLPAPRNGWMAAARLRDVGGETVLRVEASCVGDAAQPRTLRITGLIGVKDQELAVNLQPDRPTQLDLPVPATFERRGSRATLRLEPADELPDDDVLYVDLDPAGARKLLLVEPESPGSEPTQTSLPLRTAIAALAESGASAAAGELLVRTPSSLTESDLAAADVVMVADAPGFTESQANALTRRVNAGAGALFFLGPHVQPDVYNQRFVDTLHPGEGLLPTRLSGVVHVTQAETGLSPWSGWEQRHPVLRGLVDPLIGDLPLVASNAYHRFGGPLSSADETLAVCGDGTPAVIARRVGAGRVVWINASADDQWCDLPRRKSFVPLVDRLLAHLSAGGGRRSFAIGEPASVALPDSAAAGKLTIRTPSNRVLMPRLETSAGRTTAHVDDVSEAGFYTVDAADHAALLATFVVNAGRGDSRLQSADPEILRQWFAPAELQIETLSNVTLGAADGDSRTPLESWLIVLASVLLLAEMFLVHWLCPRINPALTTSHVRRRGIVPPLREREGTPL